MKKKIKLFMTILSFSLIITMFAFGVYAAQSVTFKVGGTVSYVVNDALVKITTNVYKLDSSSNTIKNETNIKNVEDSKWKKFKDEIVWTSYNKDNHFDKSYGKADLNELNFKFSFAYKIVLTITTLNTNGKVTMYPSENVFPKNVFVVGAKKGFITTTGTNFVYYIGLIDPTSNVSGNFSFPITIVYDKDI